jgi:hypothetical protein
MTPFTPEEINEIDRIWRTLPADHMWTGWAAAGERPERISIFRTRAHWRRFTLTKASGGFAVADEKGRAVAEAQNLPDLLKAVEAIPGLAERLQD